MFNKSATPPATPDPKKLNEGISEDENGTTTYVKTKDGISVTRVKNRGLGSGVAPTIPKPPEPPIV